MVRWCRESLNWDTHARNEARRMRVSCAKEGAASDVDEEDHCVAKNGSEAFSSSIFLLLMPAFIQGASDELGHLIPSATCTARSQMKVLVSNNDTAQQPLASYAGVHARCP